MSKERLRNYLTRQIGYNHLAQDIDKTLLHSRGLEAVLKKNIETFLSSSLPSQHRSVIPGLGGQPKLRWVVIPGLRGVGKTTLLLRVYGWACKAFKNHEINTIYISLDIVKNLGCNLLDVIDAYESLLSSSLENVKQPILLFIDEVQVEREWGRILKTIYDRYSNIFIVCSGSAASYLQMDADVAGRRAKIERLYPLSFIEYQMLAHDKTPAENLSKKLVKCLYLSSSAGEVVRSLKDLSPLLNQADIKYDFKQIEHYLKFGTMPFALNKDQFDIQQAVLSNVEKVIFNDLATDKRFNFNHNTSIIIKRLLMFFAGSSSTPSLETLSDFFQTSIAHIHEILRALVKAELLIKVPAYSKNFKGSRSPANYYFASPSFRNACIYITGSNQTVNQQRGQLLEDAGALHYYRKFVAKGIGSLMHPYSRSAQGNCDFILRLANQHQIALEFGLGSKTHKQVLKTMQKIKCNYGLVFAKNQLAVRH